VKEILVKFVAITSIALLAVALSTQPVSAATGWDATSIIDDVVFTNKDTMSAADIQNFLVSKVPTCDTYGTQTSEYGGGTRAQWGQANYGQSTFTCLKDYVEGGKKASQIIYDTAQNFSINPQVLLVLLQKEQGLVTDTWPLNIQYRSATGYGCPDSTPGVCASDYYGFTNQVNWAARMFRAIMNDSPTWYKKYYPYWVNDPSTGTTGPRYVQYNPDAGCGGSWLNIANRSTQALYNYTPYQPNAAALNASMGTTVYCGAYGNINFYRYFVQWFGTVRGYVPLDTPRWMQLNVDANKVAPSSGTVVMGPIAKNTQLLFTSKVYARGIWYLRSDYDTTYGLDRGIDMSNLDEIPYNDLPNTTYMQLSANTYKVNPRTGQGYPSQSLPSGIQYQVAQSITVNGQQYYRSAYDKQNNSELAIPSSLLQAIPYQNFENPRTLQVKSATKRVNPLTGEQDSTVIPAGTQYKFTSKMTINGQLYYRTEQDTNNNTSLAILADNVIEVPYTNLGENSIWLQIKSDTRKIDDQSGAPVDGTLPAGTQLHLTSSRIVDGATYYRTAYDTQYGYNKVIPASLLEQIPFTPLDTPRTMTITRDTYKVDPSTSKHTDGPYSKGSTILFKTKILINGMWYFRSDYDTTNNSYQAISGDDLSW